MSFILDALKKSEAERQRQTGPTLLEVRVTPPRRRYPLWSLIVGALLTVNVVVLLAFVLRRPAAPTPGVAPSPVAASPASAGTAPSTASAVTAPSAAGTPAAVAPLISAPAASTSAATAPTPAIAPPPVPALDPVAPLPDSLHNPADDAPAVSADSGAAKAKPAGSADYANLPSFTEVGGNLPDLRLDLHVYTERPGDRYALINMHKVREGESLPEGPRVLAITPDGVAMDYRGQEFMLRPQ
jgi:general secretion pathway protein B